MYIIYHISHDCITKANLLLQPECWLHLATTSNCVPWAGKPTESEGAAFGANVGLPEIPQRPKWCRRQSHFKSQTCHTLNPRKIILHLTKMKGSNWISSNCVIMCENIRETSGFREISGGMAQRYERYTVEDFLFFIEPWLNLIVLVTQIPPNLRNFHKKPGQLLPSDLLITQMEVT